MQSAQNAPRRGSPLPQTPIFHSHHDFALMTSCLLSYIHIYIYLVYELEFPLVKPFDSCASSSSGKGDSICFDFMGTEWISQIIGGYKNKCYR